MARGRIFLAGRRVRAALYGALAVCGSTRAHAQIDVTALARQNPEFVEQLQRVRDSSLLVRGDVSAQSPRRWQHVRESQRLAWLESPQSTQRVVWSAPRRLLMDQARRWIGLDRLSQQLTDASEPSLTGQGVVVGVVDGGIDFAHPDFQNADGTTRIAWLLDFGLPPLGLHPELEAEYGCDGEDLHCGILAASELETLLDGETVLTAEGLRVAPVPDRLGHGTHVASLAAGNGRSEPRYQGVAPEATLIVCNASEDASVSDAAVLLASRFVFERANDLGLPAVVNLSLGGDFGPHDGSSSIESALAELVEPQGRAIVVAAGNSGILYQGDLEGYEGPFGIHTEVHLSHEGSTRVPILLPNSQTSVDSALLVWIEGALDDQFAIGLERGNGDTLVPPIDPGHAVGARDGEREILLINHVSAPEVAGGEDFVDGAVVVISGDFSDVQLFAIRLEGVGNANLWLEALGSIAAGSGGEGAVFPGATRAGTITVPATSPKLIAVGATVNRDSWPSRDDGEVALAEFGLPRFRVPNTPAFFSSQGPNLAGVMKPDILAPGFAVIGAMGRNADPVAGGVPNALSMFAFSPVCGDSSVCAVVDDVHGVAVGTSMSAPIVSGAVALLLQRKPSATQAELLSLLQAGSRKLDDSSERAEPGLLDVQASVRAIAVTEGTEVPAPDDGSFLSLGRNVVYPDPAALVNVQLHLRAGTALADAEANEFEIEVEHGTLRRAARRTAPGLIAFSVAADPGSAEQRLSVRVSRAGRLLTERSVPIALDPNVAQRGVSIRGGCSLPTQGAPQGGSHSAVFALALLLRRWARPRAIARATRRS